MISVFVLDFSGATSSNIQLPKGKLSQLSISHNDTNAAVGFVEVTSSKTAGNPGSIVAKFVTSGSGLERTARVSDLNLPLDGKNPTYVLLDSSVAKGFACFYVDVS